MKPMNPTFKALPVLARLLALTLCPALFAAAASADGVPARPAAVRCVAPDRVLFACNAARGQRILVCGQLPGRVQVQLQLHARSANSEPLRFPAEAASGPKDLRYAQYGRYQLDHAEVSFDRDGTRYALFDHTENGRRQFGLDILEPGAKVETRVACQGSPQGSLRQLRPHISCDRDSEINQLDCE